LLPQQNTDPCIKLAHTRRLDQEVIGPAVQALYPGLRAIIYECYDWDVGKGPDALQDLPAIDVEYNQMRLAQS
jgi:hypothetical protein